MISLSDPNALAIPPHQLYKQELIGRILAFAPTSILDVGCGKGDLLHTLAQFGVRKCIGLEVDPVQVSNLRVQGLQVARGRAEALPFDDNSFDLVVMDYVAHHLEDLGAGLAEAARVAREAVLILDSWYDRSIGSQRVALDFDLWMKSIDRAAGDVHNPSPSAAQLIEPLVRTGCHDIDVSHRLRLVPMTFDWLEKTGHEQLSRIGNDRLFEKEFEEILDQAQCHGVSDDGAILFTAKCRKGHDS